MISIPGCAELSTENTGAIEGLLLRMIRQGLRTFGGSYSWLTAPRALTVRLQQSLATEHRSSGARSISARTSKDICVARKRVRSNGSSMRPTLERNRPAKQCRSWRPFRNNQKNGYTEAANSLGQGLEDALTLHRLGVHAELRSYLRTTNNMESLNATIKEPYRKIRW